jgi:hypothetical protein
MKKNIDFIIAVSKNSSVNKEINKISDAKWEKCKDEDGVSSNREVAETVHVMNEISGLDFQFTAIFFLI